MSYFDAVLFRAASSGTGDFVVSSAITGYRTPGAASVPNGATGSYRAFSDDLTEWEQGTYVYTSGTTTAARTVTANSLGTTAKINFTAAPQVGFVESAADLANASLLLTGTVAAGLLPVASQADQEAASSVTTLVSPGRQRYHPSAAKVWVEFTGTGTVTIRKSFNVSSITDNGTGDYTVNFTTAFSTADYSFAAIGRIDTGGGSSYSLIGVKRAADSLAAGSCNIVTSTTYVGVTVYDYETVTFIAFGDQ